MQAAAPSRAERRAPCLTSCPVGGPRRSPRRYALSAAATSAGLSRASRSLHANLVPSVHLKRPGDDTDAALRTAPTHTSVCSGTFFFLRGRQQGSCTCTRACGPRRAVRHAGSLTTIKNGADGVGVGRRDAAREEDDAEDDVLAEACTPPTRCCRCRQCRLRALRHAVRAEREPSRHRAGAGSLRRSTAEPPV